MALNKEFFDSFDQALVDYCKRVKTSGVTVTLKVFSGDEYRVATIVSRAENVISFLFYEKNGAKAGNVLPMASIPYSAITSVQVDPATAKSKFGFQVAPS